MEKLYHKGIMRTKVDDCQFVCIAQQDYYNVLHQVMYPVFSVSQCKKQRGSLSSTADTILHYSHAS